jgi:hypothetical protein
MNGQSFMISIWNVNKPYYIFLIAEIIKLSITVPALWILIIFCNLFFTEEAFFIKFMEEASHIGILLIFVIDIAYNIFCELIKKIKTIKREVQLIDKQ